MDVKRIPLSAFALVVLAPAMGNLAWGAQCSIRCVVPNASATFCPSDDPSNYNRCVADGGNTAMTQSGSGGCYHQKCWYAGAQCSIRCVVPNASVTFCPSNDPSNYNRCVADGGNTATTQSGSGGCYHQKCWYAGAAGGGGGQDGAAGGGTGGGAGTGQGTGGGGVSLPGGRQTGQAGGLEGKGKQCEAIKPDLKEFDKAKEDKVTGQVKIAEVHGREIYANLEAGKVKEDKPYSSKGPSGEEQESGFDKDGEPPEECSDQAGGARAQGGP